MKFKLSLLVLLSVHFTHAAQSTFSYPSRFTLFSTSEYMNIYDNLTAFNPSAGLSPRDVQSFPNRNLRPLFWCRAKPFHLTNTHESSQKARKNTKIFLAQYCNMTGPRMLVNLVVFPVMRVPGALYSNQQTPAWQASISRPCNGQGRHYRHPLSIQKSPNCNEQEWMGLI